jgi:Fe-S-cluster-containing dehydrogenase component
MTAKWTLVVDIEKCNGCYNCFIAAKDEYVDNAEPGYFAPQPRHGHAWVDLKRVERGAVPITDAAFMPVMCNHCDNAPCQKAAKDGAVTKRADGIVLIDPVKSKGQRSIMNACPYGAIFWNEDLDIPQAWPFDAHLLDRGWDRPRCVQSCATGALTAHKLEDGALETLVAREKLEVARPELNTKPRVFYKNLHRIKARFIAGTVFQSKGGVVDCLPNAAVRVEGAGDRSWSLTTDDFGEFKLDGLAPDSGTYTVSISAQSDEPPTVTETVTLGEVSLVLAPVTIRS